LVLGTVLAIVTFGVLEATDELIIALRFDAGPDRALVAVLTVSVCLTTEGLM